MIMELPFHAPEKVATNIFIFLVHTEVEKTNLQKQKRSTVKIAIK